MDGETRMEDAERAFRNWRRGRPASGGRIPEELWAQAASVASMHGVTKTAEKLRLNGTRLKERCELEARGRGFVEFAASELPQPHTGEFVVELEDAGGFRVRLVLRGVSIATATAAAKELWGMTR